MTDNKNKYHRYTLPIGKMAPDVWEHQKALARKNLSPLFAELITKVKRPFIQVITDLISPNAVFFQGKVLLVGDALATLRPSSALGTNQAARSAMNLVAVLEGAMSFEEWEKRSLEFAQMARNVGIQREALFNLSPRPAENPTAASEQQKDSML